MYLPSLPPPPPSVINTFLSSFYTTQPLSSYLSPLFHTSVRGGIDYKLTGEVRRIEVENLKKRLEAGDVVLLTSLGYSPSGEVFNVPSESLAAECAAKMQAAKLIYLTEGEALVDTRSGKLLQSLRLAQVTYCLFPLPYQCNYSTSSSQPTLSTHPLNPPYQPTLSPTPPSPPLSQPTLSFTHSLNPPYYHHHSINQAVSLLDKCGVSEYIRAEEDQNNNNNNHNNNYNNNSPTGDSSQVCHSLPHYLTTSIT